MKKFTDKINESVEEKLPTASEWLTSFGADAYEKNKNDKKHLKKLNLIL